MKINKKVLKIVTIAFVILLLMINQQNILAATVSAEAKTTSMKVGETTTLSINANACAGVFSITSSNSEVVTANASSSFVEGTTMETPITLTAKSAGTAIITIKATDVTESQLDSEGNPIDFTGSTSVKITVTDSNDNKNQTGEIKKEDETDKTTTQVTTPTTEKPTEPTTPTEPTFKQVNEIVYVNQDVVNVRSTWSSEGGKYGQLKKGDSVTRTGVSSETINGYAWSRISYNGKTGYVISSALTTEKIEVKEDEKVDEKEKSTNKSLKELIVNGYEITPEFNAETTKYSLTLEEKDAKVETLEITATPQDEKATVEIEGNENFKVGNNIVKITVTAEDGTTRMYSITVSKTSDDSLVEGLKLNTLKIGVGTMVPEFDPDITNYTITVEDPTTVKVEEIIAKTNNMDVTVTTAETQASENGDKVITIMLESKDGKETGVYQIYVKKAITNQAPLIEGKSDNSIYYILGVIIGVLLILIVLVIIAIKKTSDEEDDDYDYNENQEDDTYDYSLKDAINKANENYEDVPKTAKSQILKNNVEDFNEEIETDNNIDETMKFNFDDITEKTMKKFEIDSTSEIETDSKTELEPDSEIILKRKGKHF